MQSNMAPKRINRHIFSTNRTINPTSSGFMRLHMVRKAEAVSEVQGTVRTGGNARNGRLMVCHYRALNGYGSL